MTKPTKNSFRRAGRDVWMFLLLYCGLALACIVIFGPDPLSREALCCMLPGLLVAEIVVFWFFGKINLGGRENPD
jgi:hypothetical protein